MTCIVALKHGGKIYMGADSAGSDGWTLLVRQDPKIFRVGQMLIGFTTSFRMGQLLGYSLVVPSHHADVPVERYMATTFIDAVRQCLKAGGWAKREHEVEQGGNFLVAYRGRIFEICSDFQVGESSSDFASVGSGMPQYVERLRAIESVWPMRDGSRKAFAGCWAELSAEEAQTDEAVFVLVFSDGPGFVVAKREFLQKPGQGGT